MLSPFEWAFAVLMIGTGLLVLRLFLQEQPTGGGLVPFPVPLAPSRVEKSDMEDHDDD